MINGVVDHASDSVTLLPFGPRTMDHLVYVLLYGTYCLFDLLFCFAYLIPYSDVSVTYGYITALP